MMYARCPHCHTVFAIGAAALRAAHGMVRCGSCLESFDALETLEDAQRDEIESSERPDAPPSELVGEPAGEPETAADAAEEAGVAIPEEPPEDAEPIRLGPIFAVPPEAIPAPETESGLESEPEPEPEPRLEAEPQPEPEPEPAAADAIPDVLHEDLRRAEAAARAARGRAAFMALAVVLCAGLVLQLTWFQPGEALRRYPGAHAAVEWFCAHTGCVLPVRRDPSRVTVLSRDVRIHPRYEGALRIRATLMNTAPFAQPWPRLRFTLFNVNGQTIASRAFNPAEYLGPDRAAEREMKPNRPVEIGLDLLAPEEVAVSFEFAFL